MDFSGKKVFIKVKDHSVSGEEFELHIDEDLQLLKTFPQPSPEAIGRYYESDDYISHTDSRRSLFEKLYHSVKQKALRDKVKLIDKTLGKRGSLLDIGAGTGDFILAARRAGWQVAGIEPSAKAKGIAIDKGVHFIDGIQKVAESSCDVITMWHVLEHVPDIENHIRELKRIVKPNGYIVIAVPNFKSYDANYYGKFWAAYDVPRHLWHFSKTAIEKLFSTEALQLVNVKPMLFDSFYVSLLSEKYKTGRMNFIKGFISGLKSNISATKTLEYSSHIYIIKNNKT